MPDIRLLRRQISRLFALSLATTLEYRIEVFLWLTAMTATPLLSLAVWYAIARSSQQLMQQEILTYYILIIIVRTATASWRGFYLIERILNGRIVSYLIRPPVIFWEYITSFIITKLFQVTPAVILLSVLLLTAPQLLSTNSFTFGTLALFGLSLILATALSFTFDISMGLTAFWLEDAQELMAYRFLLTQVASGILIPFMLMPTWLHTALSFLPFRYTVSAPVEILLGQVEGAATFNLLAIQLIWVIGFIILLRTLYRRGLKRYAIPGQ